MNKERLKKQLETDEFRSKKIYVDTVGKVSGGIGRNLTDRGFSEDEIDLMYANDIRLAERDARALVQWFDRLNDVRQEVLVNMSFNMGYSTLAGFKKFLSAVNSGRFDEAAVEMEDSKWFKQVGQRAVRLRDAMRTGAFK